MSKCKNHSVSFENKIEKTSNKNFINARCPQSLFLSTKKTIQKNENRLGE